MFATFHKEQIITTDNRHPSPWNLEGTDYLLIAVKLIDLLMVTQNCFIEKLAYNV